ncbi:MAG: DUF1150 family protein [Paracoccaceae bacterium]
MTEYKNIPGRESERIVYIRPVRTDSLPDEIRQQTAGLEELYAICGPNGERLALVRDRAQAFLLARMNEFEPVSVH